MLGEITFPFPNINGCTLEALVWVVISSHNLLDMWLPIHAEIKVMNVW